MQVDLEELRKNIEVELKEMEQQEARLQQQIEHLVAVQNLAQGEPQREGLDLSDFREAIFGGES